MKTIIGVKFRGRLGTQNIVKMTKKHNRQKTAKNCHDSYPKIGSASTENATIPKDALNNIHKRYQLNGATKLAKSGSPKNHKGRNST